MNARLLSIMIVGAALCASCQPPPEPEARFWSWFSRNSDRLIQLDSASGALADELDAQLRRVDPGLVYVLGGQPGESRDFIISGDGITETFPAVEELVAAAPDLRGWNVIAFRQRIGTGLSLSYEGFEIGPDDIWFSTEADRDRIGLLLYIAGLTDENRNAAIGASFIVLDAAIGEYDVATKIGFIEHLALPEDPEAQGLIPIDRLPALVDRE